MAPALHHQEMKAVKEGRWRGAFRRGRGVWRGHHPTAASPASCFIFMHLQQGTQQWAVPYTILLAWNKQPFPLGPFRRDHLNRNTLHWLDKRQPPRSSLDGGARGLIYSRLSWKTPSAISSHNKCYFQSHLSRHSFTPAQSHVHTYWRIQTVGKNPRHLYACLLQKVPKLRPFLHSQL